MRRILLVIFALAFASGAQAQNYTATAGSGLTFGAKLGSGSVLFPYFIGCDATTPTQCWSVNSSGQLSITVASPVQTVGPTAVGSANANPPVVIGGTATGAAGQNVEGLAIKPASTAAAATDLSAVTNESPNSQLSVAIGTSADAPCTLPATTTACSQIALAKATANVANSPGTLSSQYPSGATALTASATGTTAATTATLAGAASKTTYICGYSIRANATANTNVTNTLTGVITGTMSAIMWVPANTAGLGVDEQIFSPCIPASAQNTAIAAVSGAPGTGGLVSVKAWGYQQ